MAPSILFLLHPCATDCNQAESRASGGLSEISREPDQASSLATPWEGERVAKRSIGGHSPAMQPTWMNRSIFKA